MNRTNEPALNKHPCLAMAKGSNRNGVARAKRRLRAITMLAIAVVLLAGCSTPVAVPNIPPAQPPDAPPRLEPVVTTIPLDMAAGAGNKSGPQPFLVIPVPQNGGPFKVGKDATDLLFEARFSCRGPPCQSRIDVQNEADSSVANYASSGTFKGRLPPNTNLTSGIWGIGLLPDSVIVGLTGEFRITVAYHGLLPADYTAFP